MLLAPHFRGPLTHQLRCAGALARSVTRTSLHRMCYGPQLPEWNWAVELGTNVLRDHLLEAFSIGDVEPMRRYLDTLLLVPPLAAKLKRTEVADADLRGTWFLPEHPTPITMLYLHGGGFAFYPKDSYASFISQLTLAADVGTFALDYPLAPEHRFPSQVEYVCASYLNLLQQGIDPRRMVVAGDSAGGNLALALLCELRDRGLPLPALAIGLSPATEFDTERPSMTANATSDWITGEMAHHWREWYCSEAERTHPRVSPIHADLRGLPAIYLQAGRAEILCDSIAAFAAAAHAQGADVTLESWPSMNHVFQFFGDQAPQSAAALRRITEVINATIPR